MGELMKMAGERETCGGVMCINGWTHGRLGYGNDDGNEDKWRQIFYKILSTVSQKIDFAKLFCKTFLHLLLQLLVSPILVASQIVN